MKKIKRLWIDNRVLFVLFLILIICFVAIVTVALSYFVGTEKSPYGDRLDKAVKIDDKFKKEVVESLKSDQDIKDASFRLGIRTIYITITFNNNVTLDDAKKKTDPILEKFDEKILKYYDIDFILTKEKSENDEGFTIMGAKNVNGSGLVWNNNTPIKDEETKK